MPLHINLENLNEDNIIKNAIKIEVANLKCPELLTRVQALPALLDQKREICCTNLKNIQATGEKFSYIFEDLHANKNTYFATRLTANALSIKVTGNLPDDILERLKYSQQTRLDPEVTLDPDTNHVLTPCGAWTMYRDYFTNATDWNNKVKDKSVTSNLCGYLLAKVDAAILPDTCELSEISLNGTMYSEVQVTVGNLCQP